VVRTSGALLVHEVGGAVRSISLAGPSLAEVAAFVGVDLAAPLSVGSDTPELGPRDAPLAVDLAAADELGAWIELGWQALDRLAIEADRPTPIQLWPEHFDASCLCFVGPGADDRCDLGVSLGDHQHEEPYLYVSPWVARRPGDASFWNAPFGALVPRSSVGSVDAAVAFFRAGLDRLTS